MKFCATLIRRGGVGSLSGSTLAGIGRLAAPLLVLSLGGCASTGGIGTSAVRTSAAAEQAFVFPPIGGPAIVGVIEGKGSGGTRQEILLSTDALTPGQNRIKVTVSRNAAPVVNPYPRIASEMRAALPGVRMARSPYYVQNRYGPFGYAFGHSGGGDLCLFGWQTIRAKASPMTDQGAIDIRVRICETGASEQKLLSVMYGYTIDVFLDSPRWNPFGRPLPPSAELGRAGGNIYPAGPDQFATVTTPIPPAQAVVRQPRARAAVQEPAALPSTTVTEPTGPRVPAPPIEAGEKSTEVTPQAPPVPLPPPED